MKNLIRHLSKSQGSSIMDRESDFWHWVVESHSILLMKSLGNCEPFFLFADNICETSIFFMGNDRDTLPNDSLGGLKGQWLDCAVVVESADFLVCDFWNWRYDSVSKTSQDGSKQETMDIKRLVQVLIRSRKNVDPRIDFEGGWRTIVGVKRINSKRMKQHWSSLTRGANS